MKMNLIWCLVFLVFSVAKADEVLEMLKDDSNHCTVDNRVAVCSDEVIKKHVDWACSLLEKNGRAALDDIRLMRFSCCTEPNYIWINDFHPRMILHPVKAGMNGLDLTTSKDQNGKFLFVEMVKALQGSPQGAWVEYVWPKSGEKTPSPKKSWVKKCQVGKTNEHWLAGSGTWK